MKKWINYRSRGVPLLFQIVFIAFYATQCCPDDPKPIDPCAGLTPFEAGFDLGDFDSDTLYVTDTITSFTLGVRAHGDYKSYRWKIGNDDREWNTKSFSLNFGLLLVGQSYNVTLIAQAPDNLTQCFPNSPQLDTVIKSFYLGCVKYGCPEGARELMSGCLGDWKGNFEDEPNDQFMVTIKDFGPLNHSNPSLPFHYAVINLPKGCGGLRQDNMCGGDTSLNSFGVKVNLGTTFLTSSGQVSGNIQCCPWAFYSGRLDPTDRNKLIIYYTVGTKTRLWRGVRI
jgi:hypothetical protein